MSFEETNIDLFEDYKVFPEKFRVLLEERRKQLNEYSNTLHEELNDKYQVKISDTLKDLFKNLTLEEVNELNSIVEREWINEFKKVENCP